MKFDQIGNMQISQIGMCVTETCNLDNQRNRNHPSNFSYRAAWTRRWPVVHDLDAIRYSAIMASVSRNTAIQVTGIRWNQMDNGNREPAGVMGEVPERGPARRLSRAPRHERANLGHRSVPVNWSRTTVPYRVLYAIFTVTTCRRSVRVCFPRP